MRVIIRMVLGAVMTVGGSYLYDNHHAAMAVNEPISAQERPLGTFGAWSSA